MIFVYFGTDITETRARARAKAHALVGADVTPMHIGADEYADGILFERAQGVSLFGTETVTVLDTLSDDVVAFESLKAALPLLTESEHTFVIIEKALLAADKKLFQKYAAECEECTAVKQERFNVFTLTDALVARDKKSLWLLYNDAFAAGVPAEEIIGTLLWQVKTMRLAARTQNAEEAGLKPFVYTKAKRALTKFTSEEMDRLSFDLLSIYHDGHSGKRDIKLGLEQRILSL